MDAVHIHRAVRRNEVKEPSGLGSNPVEWPVFPLPASIAAAIVIAVAVGAVVAARWADPTQGLLTISVIVVSAFVGVTYTGILYGIPQTPVNEIMIGALATSLGAVIAFWMSGGRK